YFFEPFDGTKVPDRWVYSKADPRAGMFTVSNGLFHADPWVNRGLQTFQDARFYQISAPLDQEARSGNQTFVVQFSVKHEQNIDCGGGYLKILPPDIDPEKLDGETPFNIMFGPDICGDKRLHIILRGEDGGVPNSRNQLSPFVDQLTHLYTLVLRPDMTYSVWMDLEEQLTGPIDKHWKGLVLPEHIPDPEAKKPEDWVDEKDMDDPEDVKPEDWKDIPSLIPDPEASQPKDWDEKEDGEWTAPMVPNPEMDDKTKEGGGSGEWKPRRIPNPEYKGSWVAPKIRNPDYQEGGSLDYTHGHVALDLWQVKSGTIFDNILITDDEDFA
ncbi:Calreticulin/calnexin, partial [Piptocephalis cylindrospora]